MAIRGLPRFVSSSAVGMVLVVPAVLLVIVLEWREPRGRADEPATAARPLILVTPGEGYDFGELDALLTIHDQFTEPVNGRLVQRLIAVPRRADLAAIDARKLPYKVIAPDAARSAFFWINRSNEGPAVLLAEAAPRVIARRGASEVLVAVAEDHAGRLTGALHGPAARRVDLGRSIRPEWIAPRASERNRERLVRAAPRARNAAVATLIDQVDPAGLRRLLEQLTGLAPIDTPGGPLTVASRFATRPEMVPLTNWLAGRLRTGRLEAAIDTFHSPVHDRDLPQVVVTLPGTDLPNELVLVTAHLDAVRGAPGADDNASGIAAIFEAARCLAAQRFRRTILFVAFNDEEQGLIGSADFARRLAEQASQGKRVIGVLNLDMVGFDADGDRRIQLQTNGSAATTLLADRVAGSSAAHGLNLVLVKIADPEESSDYASFWRVGIPAINLGDEYFLSDVDATSPPERGIQPPRGDFTSCYHRPCDRLDDPGFRLDLVADVARLLITSLADLAEIQ